MGPFAGVRALAGRLLFRDRPQGGGHYARTGRAAARRLGRSVSTPPRSERPPWTLWPLNRGWRLVLDMRAARRRFRVIPPVADRHTDREVPLLLRW